VADRNLLTIRKERNLTQEELSEKSNFLQQAREEKKELFTG
jgi:transcriptional regulator with XRE-family HTH domain